MPTLGDPPRPDGATQLDAQLLRRWPMPSRAGGDKFTRGTAVVIGGSPRTPGAARLSGEAALRMGAGRLQIITAADVAVALGVAVPESLVVPLATAEDGGLVWEASDQVDEILAEADGVLIGPGLLGKATNTLVLEVLSRIGDSALVVLDARALCALREAPDDLIPRGRLLLTPNRQELAELVHGSDGHGPNERDDVSLALLAARAFDAAITCFGRVTTADACWDMGEGSPGLGTSGSGDVLAGLALGSAARCGHAAQAACWATFTHAQAGANLARGAGELSLLARELVAEVPTVVGAVERSDRPCRRESRPTPTEP